MTDQQLIDQFESGTIQPELFHHAEHVRLAFAYLSRNPPLQALEKFTGALRKYAAAHGKPNLYHETITHAYFFLIRERIVRTEVSSWEEFARANGDLLQWKDGILRRYYRDITLQSDLARSVFLFPDMFLLPNKG